MFSGDKKSTSSLCVLYVYVYVREKGKERELTELRHIKYLEKYLTQVSVQN